MADEIKRAEKAEEVEQMLDQNKHAQKPGTAATGVGGKNRMPPIPSKSGSKAKLGEDP